MRSHPQTRTLSVKHEPRFMPSHKGGQNIEMSMSQDIHLKRWASSFPPIPDLKIQSLGGQKVIPSEYPFRIYEINNQVSLFPPNPKESHLSSSVIAEITQDPEGLYNVTAFIPAYLDSTPLPNTPYMLKHGTKLAFNSKFYSRSGSHILIILFSRNLIHTKQLDTSYLSRTPNPSVFQPKRTTDYACLWPMETRIVHAKWNFEERDLLK